MGSAIELLTKDLEKFKRELQKEKKQYREKIEKVFGEENKLGERQAKILHYGTPSSSKN